MIEALACGTPVIAWRNGSVPEVIEDGRTGFIVDSVEEAVRAVGWVAGCSRLVYRKVFEERFDAIRMARDYVEIYRRLAYTGPELAACCLTPLSRCRAQWDTTVSDKLSHSHTSLLRVLPSVK